MIRGTTTHPLIFENVSSLHEISPVARDGHWDEGFMRMPSGEGRFLAAILTDGGTQGVRTLQVLRGDLTLIRRTDIGRWGFEQYDALPESIWGWHFGLV